jgi:two-component system phosphate regulon sensor histidine kinase PhoR
VPAPLLRALLLAALAASMALAVGSFVAEWAGWAVFCAVLALPLAFHFRNFVQLERWSREPFGDARLADAADGDGILSRLYRREKNLRDEVTRRDEEAATLVAAVQALTDGVVLLDEQYRILFCNTTAEAQLGLSVSVDRGKPIANFVRWPEFAAFVNAADRSQSLLLRSESPAAPVLSVHAVACAGNRLLLQVTDVTRSDRLDRMRRDFVANVSHELRTPLTVLAGFLETLQDIDFDEEDRRRYLAMMADQSQRMQSIVKDLLALSSIEAAPPPGNEIVDMARLIDKLHRDAEALSAGSHTIIVDADARGDLRGEETELVSAFGNLVANAIRYTPAGGTVTISWHARRGGAEFSVKDTGVGIDAKHIPRLTERFYRVDRGRSREAGGTGLGLAIVKHSLNRHQAQLEIASTPGEGSRFAARFPAGRVAGV